MSVYTLYMEVELRKGFPERMGPFILTHTEKFPQDTLRRWVDDALKTGISSVRGVVDYLVKNHGFVHSNPTSIVIDQKDLPH